MAALAVQAMASVKGEGHDPILSEIVPKSRDDLAIALKSMAEREGFETLKD
jgi:hypothetical protein